MNISKNINSTEDNNIKILIVILCHYERSGWISPQLMDFLLGLRYNENYATVVTKAYNFIPAAAARNFLADKVRNVEPKPSWILMLDNDQGCPDNFLDCIKDAPEDAAVVVPKFHLFDADKMAVNLCWGISEDKLKDIGGGEKGYIFDSKFYEIDKCGTGAIFIRPEVFDKIPAPCFEYRYDALGNMVSTEDIVFCEKLKAAGLKMYGNASMTISHYHTVDLSIINRMMSKLKGDMSEVSDTDKKV